MTETASTWPVRSDGSNKTVGEMTPDEKRAVMAAAVERTKRYFERPDVSAAVKTFLSEGN